MPRACRPTSAPTEAAGVALLDSAPPGSDWSDFDLLEPDAPLPDAPFPDATLPGAPFPEGLSGEANDFDPGLLPMASEAEVSCYSQYPGDPCEIGPAVCPVGLRGALACIPIPRPFAMLYGEDTEERVQPRFHPVPVRPVFLTREPAAPETIATPHPMAIPLPPSVDAPSQDEIPTAPPMPDEFLREGETEPGRLDRLTQQPSSPAASHSWIFGRSAAAGSLASHRSDAAADPALR